MYNAVFLWSLSNTLDKEGETFHSNFQSFSKLCVPFSRKLVTDLCVYKTTSFVACSIPPPPVPWEACWLKKAPVFSPFCIWSILNLYFDLSLLYTSPANAFSMTLLDPWSPTLSLSVTKFKTLLSLESFFNLLSILFL